MDKSDILHAPPGVDDTTDVVERSQQHMLTDREKVLLILSDMSLLATDSHLKQEQRQRWSSEEAERDWLTLSPRAEMASNSKRWLRIAFGLIYTRANVALTPAYCWCRSFTSPPSHSSPPAASATTTPSTWKPPTCSSASPPRWTSLRSSFGSCFSSSCPWRMSQRYAYARQSPSTTTSSGQLSTGWHSPLGSCSNAPRMSATRMDSSSANAGTCTTCWPGWSFPTL